MKYFNYSIILFLIILNFPLSCQTKVEKYQWLPTSSAPLLYPTEVFNGSMHLEDGKSVYLPSSAANNQGWGYSGSLHLQGDGITALPIKLDITWASYKENKFYAGSWDLPTAQIKELFEKGIVNWRTNKKSNYTNIVVGCAPGGVVVVWVYGYDQQIEVARFQAKEINVEMKNFVPDNPTISQKEYFKVLGQLKPDLEAKFIEEGIRYDVWDLYRKKFKWKANLEITDHVFKRVNMEMFNGEEETIFDDLLNKNPYLERAIPRLLSFAFEDNKGVQTIFQVRYFDENEIFSIFNQLDGNLPIEIILRMNKDLSNRRLLVKQGEKEISVRKIDFDNMWEYEKLDGK